MWKIRRKLARWIAGKDATITWRGDAGFTSLNYRGEPILQDQFASDVVEEISHMAATPAELWRETRKQLVEDEDGK